MTENLKHLTEPEHWAEWFEKCAWLRCSEKTQQALENFAATRYCQYHKKISGKGSPQPIGDVDSVFQTEAAGKFWRDMEGHKWFVNKKIDNETPPPEGTTHKAYWAEIAHARPPAEARNQLEATVTYWIRDRFRDSLRRVKKGYSLDEPDSDGSDRYERLSHKLSVESIHSQLVQQSNQMDASELADQIFRQLSTDDRVILLAEDLDISLTDQRILNYFKRGKSAVYDTISPRAKSRVRNLLIQYHLLPGDSLTYIVIKQLSEKLQIWANSSECPCSECFTSVDPTTKS